MIGQRGGQPVPAAVAGAVVAVTDASMIRTFTPPMTDCADDHDIEQLTR